MFRYYIMPSGKGTYGSKVGRPSSKGMKSKTHKGDEDYTTKKGDKDFHEKGHDEKKKKKPFAKKGKVFTAKNGRKYVKNAKGQVRFIKN